MDTPRLIEMREDALERGDMMTAKLIGAIVAPDYYDDGIPGEYDCGAKAAKDPADPTLMPECAEIPFEQLMAKLMDSRVPKTGLEHYAAMVIRRQNEAMKEVLDVYYSWALNHPAMPRDFSPETTATIKLMSSEGGVHVKD